MAEVEQAKKGIGWRIRERLSQGGEEQPLLPGRRNRDRGEDGPGQAEELGTAAPIPESYFFDPNAVMLPSNPAQARRLDRQPASTVSSPDTIAAMITSMERLANAKITFPSLTAFSQSLPALQREAASLSSVHASAQLGGVDQLNEFLRRHGRSPLPPMEVIPAALYGVGLFDAHPRWRRQGENALIEMPDGAKVEGIHLKDVKFYRSESHRFPIAEVMTTDGTRFFVSQVDEGRTRLDENDPSAVTRFASALSSAMRPAQGREYRNGLQMPMVGLRQTGVIHALDGSFIGGNPIEAAYICHTLRIDRSGADATSGSFAMASGIAPQNGCLVIDGPFVAWFETSAGGRKAVPFAALVRQRDMRDPNAPEN